MANDKKARQLGEPIGTASARLRKMMMFSLLVELKRNVCHRCGQVISDITTLSMEHKEPWLDSTDPVALFFDLSNIAFSHLACNVGDARRPNRRYFTYEERLAANRVIGAASMKRNYTPEGRRLKYRRTGH